MKSRILSIAFLLAAVPAASEAANCPQNTDPQRTEVRDSEIVISDTQVGLLCHSAILSVSLVNQRTGTVSSYIDAQIDTGSDFTIVGAEAVRGLDLVAIGPETTLAAGVKGTEVKVKQYEASIQTVAGKQVPVRLLVTPDRTFPILGRDFLASFTLIYDGKNGQVSLK